MATFWVVAIAAGAVLAGLLAGIFLARRRISFAPAADPFGSLLVAVRPLLLPLFAAIVVGLAQLPFWAPILGTAVLAFVAVRFIWMPETRQAKEAENWDLRLLRRIGKHAGWLVVATLVLAAIAKAGSSSRPFHSIGGFAAYLLVFALVLWTIAFLLRFLSYASTWLKVLVALFVVLSGLRLGAAIGLVPGGDWLSAHAPWLDWALPAAAAFFIGLEAALDVVWKPWSAVELSDKFPEPTHPLVAVAEGSHVNYPNASQKRSPDWAGCQGAPAGTTTLLSYASNIRDKTEYGWQWYPAEDGWLEADAETPPMSFPGYWGASESTTPYGLFKETSLGEGHGPQTPTEQPLWRSPVTKIFCGNYTGPECDYRCKEE